MKFWKSLALTFFTSTSFAQVNNAPADFSKEEAEAEVVRQAFGLRDVEGLKAIEEWNASPRPRLMPWQGDFNFMAPSKPGDSTEPWLNRNLDLSDPSHAPKLSQVMLKYILEGWFSAANQNANDAQFRENSHRTWCSTPWVVDGASGREAVHGLTRELPLNPNPVYPADGKVLIEGLPADQKPQGWGVPYFNKPICTLYASVFGSPEQPIVPPNFAAFNSPDGFVSFKLHFNALPGWQSYEPLKGVYTWHAHVSDKPASNQRAIREIPMVQIAISMKDSRLRGTRAESDYWVMLVYTYDPNYFNSELDLPHVPEALKHMKPMGIQLGFAANQTLLFPGSVTNHMRHGQFIPTGSEALLNGPADNAYSSCMGCHAAFDKFDYITKEFNETQFPGRGTAWKISFYDDEAFNYITGKYGKGVDFNLQLHSAKKRVEAWLRPPAVATSALRRNRER